MVWTGRSACPGSIHEIGHDLVGHPADEVERLQGMFDGQTGFLGSVWDGHAAVAIVDARMLAQWQQRVAGTGFTAAASCIDTSLLAAIKIVQRDLAVGHGGSMAGYNGSDDTIEVRGIDPAILIEGIEKVLPGGRDMASAAIGNGTLRIDPNPLPTMRF